MTVDWIAKTLSMFALAVSIGFASCVDALQFNRIEATLEKVASLLRGKGGNADVPTVPGPLMDATEIIAQLAEARRELKKLEKDMLGINEAVYEAGCQFGEDPNSIGVWLHNYTDRVEVDIGLLRGAMSRFDEYHSQVKALQEIARTIEVAARKTIEAPGGGIVDWLSGSGVSLTFAEMQLLHADIKSTIEVIETSQVQLKAKSSRLKLRVTKQLSGCAGLLQELLADLKDELAQRVSQADALNSAVRQDEFADAIDDSIRAGQEALALQLDLNHLEDQISDTGSEIRDLTERIDSIQSWLERGYQYCPNRKPYSECTHTREKNQYIADRNEKRSSKEQYQQRVEDLDKLLNDLYEELKKKTPEEVPDLVKKADEKRRQTVEEARQHYIAQYELEQEIVSLEDKRMNLEVGLNQIYQAIRQVENR